MAKKDKDTDYQNWKNSLPSNLQYEGDYDLRGYYNKYGAVIINKNSTQHLTDEFKLPNHKTFSNESIYYNYSTMPQGGHWNGDVYIPNDPLIKNIIDETPTKAYGGIIMKTKYAKVSNKKQIRRFDNGGGLIPEAYPQTESGLTESDFSGQSDQNNINLNTSNSALGWAAGTPNYDPNNQNNTTNKVVQEGTNWSQIAKYAQLGLAGSKAVSSSYNPNATSQQNTANEANQAANVVAGAIPGVGAWYNTAMGASKAARGMIQKDSNGYFKNDASSFLDTALTPSHESIIDDASKGDYLGAVMHSNLGTGLIYDLATGKYSQEDKARRTAEIQNQENKDNAIQTQKDMNQRQEYARRDNYTKAYNLANPVTGREGQGIYAKGGVIKYPDGGTVGNFSSTGGMLNNYPLYHQRVIDGKPTYWKGSFTGTKEAFDTFNRNPISYVPNAMPISPDEYNQNMGTGNMMKTYTEGVDPFTNAPTATAPTIVQANGGKLPLSLPYDSKALGGKLVPLATGMAKAVGDTHEEDTNNDGRGGITLQNNNQPIAEVEDQEVMNNSKVFSDRLKVKPGVTFANMAETLGRKKGKYEEMSKSNNYREKNTGDRMTSHIDSDLDNLFKLQEMSKIPQNQPVNNVPMGANGVDFSNTDWSKVGQQVTPYLDNIYNEGIINNTPNIPTPTAKVAYDLSPATMKTNYNINPALNDADRAYKMFNQNTDETTSNPATSRGNKLGAFADYLYNKSRLYNTKENTETDLINRNNANIQSVTDRNLGNRQTIANENAGLTDTFNWAKMQRTSDINKMKGTNFANMVGDMTTQNQDHNMETLDQSRIMTDSLKYNDGAGFSKLVGTPTMDSLVRSNPQYYSQIEKALISSGQNDALEQFYKRYGKQNQ